MSDMTWMDLIALDCTAIRDLGDVWKSYATAMVEQTERLRTDVIDGHLSTDNYESETADIVREQIGLANGRFEDDLSDYADIRIATTLFEAADALEAEQKELQELRGLIETHDFEIEGSPHEYEVNFSGDLHQAILTTNPPQWLCDRVGIEKPEGFWDLDRLKAAFEGVDLYFSADELAGQYQDWLRAVMSRAHDADDDAAAALSSMRENPPDLPPRFGATYDDLIDDYKSALSEEVAAEMEAIANGESDMSPEQVNQWWENLTDTEREALINEHPEWVGPTDGIPVADRDTANRTVLDNEIDGLDSQIADIEQQLADMEADGTATVGHGRDETASQAYLDLQDQLAELENDRGDLASLQDRITDDEGNPAVFDGTDQAYYLMGFGTEGSGQAIVSIGNPDIAVNVNAYVPGTGGSLEGASAGLMNRTETMARDSQYYGGGQETATVLWLGYDAPDNVLPEATETEWAEDAADDLESFTQGIRATAEGDPANVTLTGHSYGTTVVGTAAATEGVDADNIVLVASPGTSVDTASALGVGENNVWATRNDEDVIQYGMVHGTDPTDASFGANTFTSDSPRSGEAWWEFWGDEVANHSSYWDSETNSTRANIARDNMALIVTGNETRVE